MLLACVRFPSFLFWLQDTHTRPLHPRGQGVDRVTQGASLVAERGAEWEMSRECRRHSNPHRAEGWAHQAKWVSAYEGAVAGRGEREGVLTPAAARGHRKNHAE